MSTNKAARVFAASGILFALCLTGCGGGGGVDNAPTGTISISVTDAPVDEADAVVIDMVRFEFKPKNGPAFFVDVADDARQLDLTDFANGMAAPLILNEEVPAGGYSWLAIHVAEATSFIRLEAGGGQYPLLIPGNKSELKLVSTLEVPVNRPVAYLIDFDLRKVVTEPVGQTGPNGEPRVFYLRPAMRIMNVADTGGVMGVVDQALVDLNNPRCSALDPVDQGNAVYVFQGMNAQADDVAATETDQVPGPITSDMVELDPATGQYRYNLMFLLPDQYTIAFTCSAGADDSDSDEDFDPNGSNSGVFNFDAAINVEIITGVTKSCDIPQPSDQADPC